MTRRWPVLAALAALLALGVGLVVFAGGDDGDGDAPPGDPSGTTTTTLDFGDLDIPTPDGWNPVPLPTLGFGLAVPPEWQATRTDDATLDVLEQRNLETPGFLDAARNAAAAGAVLYAAHLEAGSGAVDDVKVQVLTRPGATSAAQLGEIADGIIADQEIDTEVEETTIGDADVVRFTFRTESDGIEFFVTQVLAAGDDRVISLIITSESDDGHADLAAAIAATLTLAP